MRKRYANGDVLLGREGSLYLVKGYIKNSCYLIEVTDCNFHHSTTSELKKHTTKIGILN